MTVFSLCRFLLFLCTKLFQPVPRRWSNWVLQIFLMILPFVIVSWTVINGSQSKLVLSGSSSFIKRCRRGPQKVPKRASFRMRDIADSVIRGCRSCRTLKAFLECISLTYPGLDNQDLVFRWTDYHFNIEVVNDSKNQHLELQFFLPSGKRSPLAFSHLHSTQYGI